MIIQKLLNEDIDGLRELQPEGWTDIRQYFYYYSATEFCEPLKLTEGGKIIALGTTIRHEDSAWLAHIIVHPDFRNRGLGREIVTALLNNLNKETYKTIYLDATNLGYPLYKKLGFEIETEYVHLDGEHTDQYLINPKSVIPYHSVFKGQVIQLDKLISGENRIKVLQDHLVSSLLYISNGNLFGAYFPSLFDGYIMALNPLAGTELMKLRMRTKNTARLPIINQVAINFLLENGYKQVQTSKRMILGEKREWKGEAIFNRISGGLG